MLHNEGYYPIPDKPRCNCNDYPVMYVVNVEFGDGTKNQWAFYKSGNEPNTFIDVDLEDNVIQYTN